MSFGYDAHLSAAWEHHEQQMDEIEKDFGRFRPTENIDDYREWQRRRRATDELLRAHGIDPNE